MSEVTACPICKGSEFQHRLDCIDYTVSHETFAIKECDHCHLFITSPQPDSLAKYYASDNYVSHSTRSTSLFDVTYRLSRHFTIKWKLSLLKRYGHPNSRSVLDFGCGVGTFLQGCIDHGFECQGVEPSPTARKIAIQSTGGIAIAESLAQIQRKADLITAWHVIEHVPDLSQSMEKLASLLNENGTMFIAVPNRESFDAQKYKERWAAFDVPRHLWHFSKNNMALLLERSGLSLQAVVPMKLDSYYVSMMSEKNAHGKLGAGGLLRALTAGFSSNVKGRNKMNYSSLIYIAKKK